jgi:single-strand DNA-binding protein
VAATRRALSTALSAIYDSGKRQGKGVVLPLVSWGRQAERDAQYLHKGAHVAVEFRIDNVEYEQDGENVFDFQFTVEAIEYLDSKAQAEQRRVGKAAAPTETVDQT